MHWARTCSQRRGGRARGVARAARGAALSAAVSVDARARSRWRHGRARVRLRVSVRAARGALLRTARQRRALRRSGAQRRMHEKECAKICACEGLASMVRLRGDFASGAHTATQRRARLLRGPRVLA
jgi:hypothetical protein